MPSNSTYTMVLFDLDGTLLPIETDRFMRRYMESLYDYCVDVGLDAGLCMEALKAGIWAMAENKGRKTNHAAFWDAFCAHTGYALEKTEPIFDEYYRHRFMEVGDTCTPNPAAARAVETLKRKGYRLAVATMPMFPLHAIEQRIRWAGVDPADFEFATDYRTTRDVKPNAGYYREVLARAGVAAGDVLMVGNHNREDGFATKLGCDIYLVCDHLIEVDEGIGVADAKHGSMADFARFCEELPRLA